MSSLRMEAACLEPTRLVWKSPVSGSLARSGGVGKSDFFYMYAEPNVNAEDSKKETFGRQLQRFCAACCQDFGNGDHKAGSSGVLVGEQRLWQGQQELLEGCSDDHRRGARWRHADPLPCSRSHWCCAASSRFSCRCTTKGPLPARKTVTRCASRTADNRPSDGLLGRSGHTRHAAIAGLRRPDVRC